MPILLDKDGSTLQESGGEKKDLLPPLPREKDEPDLLLLQHPRGKGVLQVLHVQHERVLHMPMMDNRRNAMFARERTEKREENDLAPYAMKSILSRGRFHPEEGDPFRTAYQRDRDRIIHSTAFRRLEYKTQVFVNNEGDYYRTRLTHTLEVTQIARSIARSLNLNEDLVEAIALAHDLGHTPFGHAGEEALNGIMKDEGGFDHNLQGLRVVDLLEERYPEFPGLNLTYEVREFLAKHSDSYRTFKDLPFDTSENLFLEAQVVDCADRIAYNHHDIDDGMKSGILTEEAIRSVKICREAFLAIDSRGPFKEEKVRHFQVIKLLINRSIVDIIENTTRTLEQEGIRSLQEVRGYPGSLVRFSPEMESRQGEVCKFLYENFYRNYRISRMAGKAKKFIHELFKAYLDGPNQLPPNFQLWVAREGLKRGICDYIAGMTDRRAQEEYRKLFYPFERV